MLKNYTDFMSKLFNNVIYKFYCDLKFKDTLVKFYEDFMPVIEEMVRTIIELIAILLNNLINKKNSNLDMPDPNEDEPGPEGGDSEPNGDDSDPQDNDSNNNKKLDKGKGKAKDITPEAIPEEDESNYNKKLDKGKGKAKAMTPEVIPEENKEAFTDYDEKMYQNDLEKAKLNSLKRDTAGESSKEGATLQQREDEKARLDSLREHRGEPSTQGTSLGPNESAETQKDVEVSYDYYCKVSESRRVMARNFNDIAMKLNSKDDNLSPEQRQFLLDESVQLRKDVTKYDIHIENVKKLLNISSDEEDNNPYYSSEESKSESSEEEESRPHKRPRK